MSDLQAIALCIALGSVSQAIGMLILAREIRALVETAKAEGGSEVAALRDLQASLDPIIAELKAARSRRETDSENLNSQLAATSAALRGAL